MTGGESDNGLKIQTGPNQHFSASIGGASNDDFYSTWGPASEINNWYNLIMVVDRENNLMSLYINGEILSGNYVSIPNLSSPIGIE